MHFSRSDYHVGCICAKPEELAAVQALLDDHHPPLSSSGQNIYVLGRISNHNIVIATLPGIGNNPAATAAALLLHDFPSIRFGLLVGIGGGIPDQNNNRDIRLGDVVVSMPDSVHGGVIQYDMGKSGPDGFERRGSLNKPPQVLQTAVVALRAKHIMKDSDYSQNLRKMKQEYPKMFPLYDYPNREQDRLFESSYKHRGGGDCTGCDKQKVITRDNRQANNPSIHYGTIGSGNRVVGDATDRDRLKQNDPALICVEMEAAGLMDTFPCLVIRGISDYADSHKNDKWQHYAAATAACYTKELLSVIAPVAVQRECPADPKLEALIDQLTNRMFENLGDFPDSRFGFWRFVSGPNLCLYRAIYDAIKESNGTVRFAALETCLPRNVSPRAKVAWELVAIQLNKPVTKNYFLAIMYMIHVGTYLSEQPRTKNGRAELVRKDLQYIHRFDEWVSCYCSPDCWFKWNFINSRGICQGPVDTHTTCKVAQFVKGASAGIGKQAYAKTRESWKRDTYPIKPRPTT